MESSYILFFSSFIFITNAIASFLKKYYFYSFLFLFLTLSSLIFYSGIGQYILTFLIDQVAVFLIVLYGAYVLYNKLSANKFLVVLLIILMFLMCIYLFCYGYFAKQYCYHPNKTIADSYHCLLHFIASTGHHLVIFL
jgi:hypothetical protein